MSEYIFAYGTLLPENVPTDLGGAVRKLKFVGNGHIHGKLYDLGDFPGAVLNKSAKNRIYGRVYELPGDQQTLKSLDKYEEYYPSNKRKSLYVRRKAVVTLKNRKKLECWVYEYNRDVSLSPVIKSGEYSKIAA